VKANKRNECDALKPVHKKATVHFFMADRNQRRYI